LLTHDNVAIGFLLWNWSRPNCLSRCGDKSRRLFGEKSSVSVQACFLFDLRDFVS
jgi:hypothetical protein